jgi:hypothetical protein
MPAHREFHPRRARHARRGLACVPALLGIAMFSASAGPASPDARTVAASPGCTSRRPTTLDYMVLASMAESSQPLGMAGYRPSKEAGKRARPPERTGPSPRDRAALEEPVRLEEIEPLML